MSDNKHAVKAFYDAVAGGNIPAVLGLIDPQCTWNEAENFIYADGNPYIGPQAVLMGVFARFAGEWNGFSATSESMTAEGDTVISQGRYRATYKATGKSIDAPFAHVFTLKDGKIVRFQQYTDTAQFRDAVS
ncbi:MAG TPA: nuclear transport factor 2 family protein [Bryobacteraceae bacterium]|nr:nuclear transport factor 2 family protein [Bryobacteraceae bacterium]